MACYYSERFTDMNTLHPSLITWLRGAESRFHMMKRLSVNSSPKWSLISTLMGRLNLFLYHFGMYVIFGSYLHTYKMAEELTGKTIEKRFIESLPKVEYRTQRILLPQCVHT